MGHEEPRGFLFSVASISATGAASKKLPVLMRPEDAAVADQGEQASRLLLPGVHARQHFRSEGEAVGRDARQSQARCLLSCARERT